MSKLLRAHISVAIVQILYAANFSIAKQVMPLYIQPYGFIVLRVIPAALFFFIAAWFIKREKLLRKDLGTIILCAITGVVINQLLFFFVE